VETLTAALHVASFVLGAMVVAITLASAVGTFVLPRGVIPPLTRAVFLTIRVALELWLQHLPTYAQRDRVLAVYAPFGLLSLPVVWLALVLLVPRRGGGLGVSPKKCLSYSGDRDGHNRTGLLFLH